MESLGPHQKQYQFQNPQNQHTNNSGLSRYRSAPSSYFASFVDESMGFVDTAKPPSPETERIIAGFMEDSSSVNFSENSDSRVTGIPGPEYLGSPMLYQKSYRPPLPNQCSKATEIEKFGTVNNNSNLFRHSSSPAGLIHDFILEKGFVRNMRSLGGESCFSPEDKLKNQINFSSVPPSSSSSTSGLINQNISPTENGNNHNCFLPSFPSGYWEESLSFTRNLTKNSIEDDQMFFSSSQASETQEGNCGLSRHMSLPNTPMEVEKYLQLQDDSVRCKIRAKRGCATHPRSIAERVRRTRISERMRKLQDLVPNMDKQTSTADMLDFAVDYIKGLQNQLKGLSENRSNCCCSASNQRK